VKANQATYPVRVMCRVLKVSASGYYAWFGRAPSARRRVDEQLLPQIKAIHARSKCSYGAPRIRAELADTQGCRVGKKRVARLMCAAGIQGVQRPRFMRTTVPEALATAAPDRVERRFSAQAPNRLWVADITYIPTLRGFLYLAVVLDAYSRRVVGWSMRTDLSSALVIDALNMALLTRAAHGVIHHSDHGCQYASHCFAQRCQSAGVHLSMGSVGDAYDNAMAESFFATIKCELLSQGRFTSHTEARNAIFEYIEGWYNAHRRHSALNYLSPINYERRIEQAHDVQVENQ
jgi:putative transposase